MKNNGILILAGGGLLAFLLLRKKDTAGAKPSSVVSDNNSGKPVDVTTQPVMSYNTYNEYNTYEQTPMQEAILPPVEDQSQIKVIPTEPTYTAPTGVVSDFPTVNPVNDATPYKTQPAPTTVKSEPTNTKTAPVPAPTVVPSSIRQQSTVLTAQVKGINGKIETCLVRPNLGKAVHAASRVIYLRTGNEVRVFAVNDASLLYEYKNYGFHRVSQ